MIIPAEKWLSAIKIRKSRRKFNEVPVPDDMQSCLVRFCDELNNVFTSARVVFSAQKPDSIFRGLAGSYGKVKGAPAFAAFLGDPGDEFVGEKAGYLGEAFVLEATALGLATCWIAGFFSPQRVRELIDLSPGEKIFAVTPVGYAGSNYSLEERILSGFVGSRKRKDLPKIIQGIPLDQCKDWVKTAVEAAQIAPSAVNRQPWTFLLGEDSITVSVNSPEPALGVSKRLDCGIAMLHLEVGALAGGVKGFWEYLNPPEVARFVVEEPLRR